MTNNIDFYKRNNIITFRKKKKFKSKKNCVTLFEGWSTRGIYYQWIKKEYSRDSRMEKEYEILQSLFEQKINVPEVYDIKEKEIIMEYIEGDILLNYIEKLEKENIKGEKISELIKKILDWLASFYNAFSGRYVMEDINFRNFILKDNNIWGLDFEDCQPGKKERDIGRICAFAITYVPLYSRWKIYFVKEFLKTSLEYFPLDLEVIEEAYRIELMAIEERRNIKIKQDILNLIDNN